MSVALVGIDTGGTFTDVVYRRPDGTIGVHKVPSTPTDPAIAVLAGLEAVGLESVELVHGSTVATNALLERAGARAALITTAGFEDLLVIGRQTRAEIYNLNVSRVPPLIDRTSCFGVVERIGADGEVLVELTEEHFAELVRTVTATGVEAVAICLLHAYANPAHEARLADGLRAAGIEFVCASHEILPEFREYERCSTTSVNAYVGPVMGRYLRTLADALGLEDVRIMQSNGGALSVDTARRRAVETVLSGPAGGVLGAFELAAAAGYHDIISFDMGGTSTDVSLCAGALSHTSEAYVGGLPVRVPMLDIHTVGAGGGSIAWRDPAGGLRVGPRSAGAAPGPACYGLGGREPTVTDANLYLGRLVPDHFLGGARDLDVDAARAAVERHAAELNMTGSELAAGILAIADSTMEGAIRVISVERGHDPADFTLVCFGGAGGLHAASLAAALAMPRVLVPPHPGTLSAHGMLLADIVRDYSQTLLVDADELRTDRPVAAFDAMEAQALDDLAPRQPTLARSIDMRYRGQGYELTVADCADPAEAFHTAHEQRYGYADRSRALEVVTLRVRAAVRTAADVPAPVASPAAVAAAAPIAVAQVQFDGRAVEAAIHDRAGLEAGARFAGPAIVVEYSSTTVVPPEWTARVDGHSNLVLEREEVTGA
jgi:N-methylhydantoinase A